MTFAHLRRTSLALACGALSAVPTRAQQPTAAPPVTLAQALTMAEGQSEAIAIARAAVTRAQGEELRARSQLRPQLTGSAGYTRTLNSQYQGAFSSAPRDTTKPEPPPGPCEDYLRGPGVSTEERLIGLENASRCANGTSAFSGFGNLGFGAANQYDLGLQFSQSLYSGGRLSALTSIASAGVRTADVALAEAQAELRLEVAQAYLNAALSDRLLQIAESSLVQTDDVLTLTRAGKQAGGRSEFELLRAQVAHDNQRPLVIQQRTARDLAYLRLKQLLNVSYDAPLQLVAEFQDSIMAGLDLPAPDTSAASRSTVRQATEAVDIQHAALQSQHAQRYPSVGLTSRYGRVAFPQSTLPSWGDFRTNWTIGVGVQIPLLTGGRQRGDEMVGEANLLEAKLRLQQTIELSALDARSATAAVSDAQAAWAASAGTVEQANKAYSIAQVRYQEGLSTQVELSESRILLQQAEAIRAQAARDLQVARIRLALLRDLPVGSGGSAGQQNTSPSGSGTAGTSFGGAN